VISFLAGLLGLGGISEKIKSIFETVKKPVSAAIHAVVNGAIKVAKGLLSKLGLGKKNKAPDERTDEQKRKDLDAGVEEGEKLLNQGLSESEVRKKLPQIEKKYRLVSLSLVVDRVSPSGDTVHLVGEINPTKVSNTKQMEPDLTPEEVTILQTLKGGQDLLNKLPNVAPEKRNSLMQEARVALEEVKSGKKLVEINNPTFKKDGIHKDTEIDVETESEIIEVKGGDYSQEDKLIGRDLKQWRAYVAYNQLRVRLGQPPKQIVHRFVGGPVNPGLVKWLTERGVVVRLGKAGSPL
jgi:hypothetical protein